MAKQAQVILGVDPGSRITGYGVIALTGHSLTYIASGCIKIATLAFPQRLKQIHRDLTEIIQQFQPDSAAIEKIFVHANIDGALKLGHARGAAITTIVQQDIDVAEYSAKQVKQAVVGYGAADKSQIQTMVKTLLNLSAKPQADAADALAVAICHAHMQKTATTLGVSSVRQGRWR